MIHSANPKSRPVGIIVFAPVVCPSVRPHFSNLEKQNFRKQCSLMAWLWIWPSGSLMTPGLCINTFSHIKLRSYTVYDMLFVRILIKLPVSTNFGLNIYVGFVFGTHFLTMGVPGIIWNFFKLDDQSAEAACLFCSVKISELMQKLLEIQTSKFF